ncbi:MAG TPA: class I tRNA ligase family protein, partial [Stellaceae bacterium]|nr:class I tRNA ligase family protein [Stellaceae bacterium]
RDLIDRYGCDALRFTLSALAAPGRDIKLAESRVEGYRNFVTKLWNAARYADTYDCVYEPGFDPTACELTENRWIAGALRDCAMAVTAALDAYRFDEAANRLYQFVWGTFCDWYVELTKPILQGEGGQRQEETRAMTAWVLGQIVHLLHPIAPFVTEELWSHLSGGEGGMLMTAAWPEMASGDVSATAEMEWIVAAISAIRGVRSEMNVPPGAYVPYLVKDADASANRLLERNRDHLLRLARITPAEATATVAGGIQVVVEGATFLLDLGEVVDLGQEKTRLGKEIGRLDADLARFAAKLGNPGFLAKAKPEIIEEQREREADTRRDRDRLKAAYERLGAV